MIGSTKILGPTHKPLTPNRALKGETADHPSEKSGVGEVHGRDRALYADLRERLVQAGCFRPAPWTCIARVGMVSGVLLIGYVGLLAGPEALIRLALAALVAFAVVQSGFIAHDAGDGGITGNRRLAFGLRHGLMSFVSALSSSYFEYLHKVHHLTLQRGGGMGRGAVAVNPYEVKWFKRLVARNGVLFVAATICLRGVTFQLESIRYVLRNWETTKTDRVLMALHAACWLVLPLPFIGLPDTIVNYALITLLTGPYVGTVLILNHAGMSAARNQSRIPLFERVTRSTRNLGASRWSEFILGGVNNHIEHHLFPEIPTARLRRARSVTRDFLLGRGISYVETDFLRAFKEAVNHFRSLPSERLVREALS